ncbi:MAG: NUDIX hydrolase [Planctomycetes bacterium]|nr:NUDIX hydrolase [Planctomycetota bacterium]
MRVLLDTAIRRGYRLAYLGLRAWWLVRRPATHGTGVALWHDGKILLVRTSYRPCYSLPGGFVRPGEPSEQAARREVREEIGLDLSGRELRLAWSGTLPFEARQDTTDIWEVQLESPPAVRITSHEIVWTGWMHPAEALKNPLLPHIAAYLEGRR